MKRWKRSRSWDSALEKRTELTDRIAKMQRDQIQFRTEVDALAASIGLSPSSDTSRLCQAVVDCIADAAKTIDRRLEVEARLAVEQGKARALADETAEVQAQASQMMNHFGVGSLTEVDGRLRALARRADLEARSIKARDELLEGMQVETIEQAESILDTIDRGSLEAELIALKQRFDDEDGRSRDLFSARNRADDRIAAVGGDAAVAILDAKRRTVLLTIEDRALAYLRLKLGTAAADRALRAYRDRHRSSMMTRASEAFALISRGAYSELVTQPSNGSELLIAKGSDGGSKIASELSKGTRFQLYLALRVAGYHEFARAQLPLHFSPTTSWRRSTIFERKKPFGSSPAWPPRDRWSTSPITAISAKSRRPSSRRRSSTTFSRAHASEQLAGRPSSHATPIRA